MSYIILSFGFGLLLSSVLSISSSNFIVFEASILAALVSYFAVLFNMKNKEQAYRESLVDDVLKVGWDLMRDVSSTLDSLLMLSQKITYMNMRVEDVECRTIEEMKENLERMATVMNYSSEANSVARRFDITLVRFLNTYEELVGVDEFHKSDYEEVENAGEEIRSKLQELSKRVARERMQDISIVNYETIKEQNIIRSKLSALKSKEFERESRFGFLKLEGIRLHLILILCVAAVSFGYIVSESIQEEKLTKSQSVNQVSTALTPRGGY
ncbi:hypothetical protein [Salinicola lusitanus]|uniref:hypothetical protein n=1 Tax=Salinicola lusitanus TaxID=1949085 RepID=UPI00130053EE|nr:hypothetical protein [Salinicola lusitanus]